MVRLVVAVVAAAVALAGLAPVAAAQPATARQPTTGATVQSVQAVQSVQTVQTVQAVQAGLGFVDVVGGVHQPAIDALNALSVFDGTECSEQMFCPDGEIKRWTMAVWLVRVLDRKEPPAVDESSFADAGIEAWYLPHIERLAELGVTRGCLTEPLRFCPDKAVTRAQMATLLVRAFDLGAAAPAGFADTAGNTHEANIDALAAARITAGCQTGPLRFCPDEAVTRAQMATLLARALGLVEKPATVEDEPAEDTQPPPTAEPDPSPTATAADPAACRPRGTTDTTAGFPLPDWAAPSIGTMRVAVLFLDFHDARATYSTEAEAAHGLPYAEEYLQAASYGRLDVEFVALHGWLRAPLSADDYVRQTVVGEVRVNPEVEAVRLADPVFDFTGYHAVMTVLPSAHFGAGEFSSQDVRTDEGVIGSMAWINTAAHSELDGPEAWGDTAAHELAHSLGLSDLYPYDGRYDRLPEAPDDKRWMQSEFGLMGLRTAFAASPRDRRLSFELRLPGRTVTVYNYSLNALEMLAWSRWQLGWLSESQIRCINAPAATVTLGPVADPRDSVAMAAVPLSETEVLVMESRRRIGYDAGREYRGDDGVAGILPVLAHEGVLVYTVDASLDSGQLPARLAGDRGDGLFDDYPLLTRGRQVTVRGHTIAVMADHGDTHTVTITKAG